MTTKPISSSPPARDKGTASSLSVSEYKDATQYSIQFLNLPGADLFAVTADSRAVHVFGFGDLTAAKTACEPTEDALELDPNGFVTANELGRELGLAADLGRRHFGEFFRGVFSEVDSDEDLGGPFLYVSVLVTAMPRPELRQRQRDFIEAFGRAASPEHLDRLVISVKRDVN